MRNGDKKNQGRMMVTLKEEEETIWELLGSLNDNSDITGLYIHILQMNMGYIICQEMLRWSGCI